LSELEVAYIATTDLIPYANNPRTHSDQQVLQVASSIKEFGFNNPILIDEHNGIIAGHGRLAAAQKLDLKLVPTITLAGLSEAQRKAYVIADNKLTENGGWDVDALRVEIERLSELDFDIELTGMDANSIKEILDIEVDLPELFTGDKEPFQQKTFTLHDEQASIVEDAINLARTDPSSDQGLNENANGNAISYVCEQWLKMRNA
jgi:ParB-like chromosome segregation protein Spo0J